MAKKTTIIIKEHNLVPPHTIVSEKEKEKLFKKYNISPSNLPRILKDDSALSSLKVKEGDVIRIERNSPTAGKVEFYRLVVDD